MKPAIWTEVKKALDKAEEALQSATSDFEGNHYLTTANRCYYVCYYCMIGLLYSKNIFAKTHQGVRTKFSELFIKTALFPTDCSEIVTTLFATRQEADYDLDANINKEEAIVLINKARLLLTLAKEYFANHNS